MFNEFRSRTQSNDLSNVYYVELHNANMLFMGDSTTLTENLLLNDPYFTNIVHDVDYYQVGHHGSDTSTSYAFVNYIHPKYCMISGEDRGNLHFPKASVLNTLNAVGCNIYITNGETSYTFNIL